MTTYNTGNPIGSTDSRDRLDNTENMDYLENSTTELTHADRFGTVRKTRHGMEVEHDAQIAAHESEHDAQMQSFENDFDGRLAGMAFTRVGSFTDGYTLTNMRQTLEYNGHEYSWSGAFPKVVAPGTDPTAVGSGYISRTDVVLRGELAGIDGANFIGGATYAQLRAYSGDAVKIQCVGRDNVFDNAYGWFHVDESDTTSADNDATILIDALGKRWKRQWIHGVMPEWFGAKGDGVTFDDTALANAFSFARTNGIQVVGRPSAVYLVSQTVNFRANFNGNFCSFKASNTFSGEAVIKITETSLDAERFSIVPNSTSNKVPLLIGLLVDAYNFKGTKITGNYFDFGLQITSFSCTMLNCSFAGCNTNVSAYAPTSSREINAINFIGGEYWGGRDYAFNIGDDRFSSTVIPQATHGKAIKIIGCTTDKSVMRFDKVADVEISCYFEAGIANVQNAYIQIVNTNGVMGGFNVHDCTVHNSAGTVEYFIKADREINGLSVDRIFYSAIPKCLVYAIKQDIYPTYIGALIPVGSHTLAPAIHLGMRTNQPYGFNRFTILGKIANGIPGPRSKYLMAGINNQLGEGVTKRYIGGGWVNTDIFGREFVGIVVSPNAFRITNSSDMVALEAGMCVRIGSAGTGTHTYILGCDYENNIVYLDNYTLTSETVISAKEDKSFTDFFGYQIPQTTTGYELGSRCWNKYTVTQTPVGWSLTASGWVAFS